MGVAELILAVIVWAAIGYGIGAYGVRHRVDEDAWIIPFLLCLVGGAIPVVGVALAAIFRALL